MPDPADTRRGSNNNLTVLDYPLNIGGRVAQGEHYMMIDSFESLSAISSGNTKKSSIALYIPPNALKTGFTANYEGISGAAEKANIGAGFQEGAGEGTIRGLVGIVQSTVRGLANVADKTGFLAAGSGLAVNNHIALVYRGPGDFRTHDFTFDFWPKSPAEASRVETIIKDFQNGMLPRMVGPTASSRRLSEPFFKSPRHYKITFYSGGSKNTKIFEIRTSVINNMTVNYDPEGIVSFHEDGYPVHSRITLQFKEIEYVISGDSVPSQFDTAANVIVTNQAQAAAAERRERNLAAMGGQGPGRNPHTK